MKIRNIFRIAVPILLVAMLIGVMALDAPAARALAKHGGEGGGQWNFPNPPGWSNHNGVARFDGPGHWINPPGWSNHNGIARLTDRSLDQSTRLEQSQRHRPL